MCKHLQHQGYASEMPEHVLHTASKRMRDSKESLLCCNSGGLRAGGLWKDFKSLQGGMGLKWLFFPTTLYCVAQLVRVTIQSYTNKPITSSSGVQFLLTEV